MKKIPFMKHNLNAYNKKAFLKFQYLNLHDAISNDIDKLIIKNGLLINSREYFDMTANTNEKLLPREFNVSDATKVIHCLKGIRHLLNRPNK